MDKYPRYIQAGEPVTAAVGNRAPVRIQQNVQEIYDLLLASNTVSTSMLFDRALDLTTLPGMPVYLDAATKTFKPALAVTDLVNGSAVLGAAAQYWGIVVAKTSSKTGHVLISGYARVDISSIVLDGPVVPGLYYLSTLVSGGLIRQQQPVSIPVLRADGQGGVLVLPNLNTTLDRHVHYRIPMYCRPCAGTYTPPSPGNRHSIAVSDPSTPGWLPANHAVFNGKAPAGAAFGYNLDRHPELKTLWPPIPLSEVSLEWDRGLDNTGISGVPLGRDGLCVIDSNGIWWMSDCWQDVPWPWDYGTNDYSLSLSDPSDIECPRWRYMRMQLCFSKVSYASTGQVVSALTSKNSRLTYHCLNGVVGQSGVLETRLDLAPDITSDTVGHVVVKTLTDNLDIKAGPVCEGIYTTNPLVVLSGPNRRRKVVGDSTSPWLYQGEVAVDVVMPSAVELPASQLRLDGVEQDVFDNCLLYTFPTGEKSLIRAQIDIPHNSGLTNPQMQLRFRLIGRASGTLPTMTLTARRIPATSGTPLALPLEANEFSVSITTAVVLNAANKYIDVTSAAFTVANGETVYFTLQRNAGDGYAGAVGLIRAAGVLSTP